VNHRRREQAKLEWRLFMVVPTEKIPAERAAVLDTPEAVRNSGRYFMVPELTFRIRVSSETWDDYGFS